MIEPAKRTMDIPADKLQLLVEQLKRKQSAGTSAPIPRAARTGLLPLSYSQQRLWFLEQLEPGTSFYNLPWVLRMHGRLRREVLAASIDELARRHDSLRTRFVDLEGRPYQVVDPPWPAPLPLIDLSGLPPAAREAELRRQATTEARRPFDLARGPLLRLALFQLAGGDQAVIHNMHHIISDGWSAVIFVREIAVLYEAFAAGRPSPLPALPLQYVDYAVWQREHLRGAVLERHLAYWRQRLAGCRGLELPGDRPRPAIERFRGKSREVWLDDTLFAALSELVRRDGVTLFMVLLAIFKGLLWRYTGQGDVAVGSPIANRNRREVEGVIGFFSNTVVLRTGLGDDPTGRQLLARVQEATLGAYEHEDLPFEVLVEELQPERDMSRNPLFQVMCVLQNQPRTAVPSSGLTFSTFPIETATAKFDLTMFWRQSGARLEGVLEHNSDLLDDSTALRFYHHFESLGRSLAEMPELPLSALPLLDEGERHQLLREWSGPAADRGSSCLVHVWVEAQAARTPGAAAVIDGDRRLTYDQLNRQANRLAHALARRGVRPEALVGICVERSMEMVVATLAVLKAGGAIVALDPAHPWQRLAAIIDDARLAALVTQEDLLRHFPAHEGIAFCLDRAAAALDGQPEGNPASGVTLDNAMYAIYTSGSTGQPKGILVTHANFANLLAWQLQDRSLSAQARTVQFATFGFCVSFQEIFSSWCSGGTLVLAGEMTRRDVAGLPAFLEAEQVARLHLPYAALKHLADAVADAAALPARLRDVITAGEQLRITPQVRALFERLGSCRLHNQYGASETHVVSAFTLGGEPASWPSIPPVGRAIANVSVHLLDRWLEPVPIGVRGEICAGGACVARAYLNDPELTAQKMIPDPFAAVPGARLYRTGDLGRCLADGSVEHVGRLDGQVKIRGFRVEVGEVETVLARHPAVRDSAVVALPGGPAGEHQLVAYVVGESGGDPVPEDLREHLKRVLPEYMVPRVFVPLPRLPLNANGKLDQAALPPPPEREGQGLADGAAPRTPVEEMLAGIWEEVLHSGRVGIHDSFFELGGHSLLATQVVSRSRGAFGVDLPLRALFEAPTVAQLAARIEELRQRDESVQLPPLAAQPRTGRVPLSFAQERLWFLGQYDPGSSAYNLAAAVRLAGRFDTTVMQRCFVELVWRHEALRTCLPLRDGEPAQVVTDPAGPVLPVVDLAPLGYAADAAARRLAEACARRPFDLARGPLFRPLLLRVAADRAVLLLAMHHIISDGWSMEVLVRELAVLYRAFSGGRPSPLQPLALQFADFAIWQRRWLGEALVGVTSAYAQRLAGVPPKLELPSDLPRPAVRTAAGATASAVLPAALTDGLRRMARGQAATLFMVLLSGLETLLARHSGEEVLAIGTPIAARNHLEIEDLIGFFVNTLVLRADTSGDPTGNELLAKVREETLAAYAHQDLPFERLVEQVAPERSLSRTPLFQVMFVLQNTPLAGVNRLTLPGLTLAPYDLPGNTAKFDLTLAIAESAGRLAVTAEYSTDLFDGGTIARMLGHFERLLGGLAGEPAAKIAELPLLSVAERHQLLVQWGGAQTFAPGAACLHELFAMQAALHPEAPAVVCDGELLSYGDLARRAARTARRLAALGAGPGTLVGLCVERGLAMVTSILAILETGAAYVPLDPAQPRERLEFMVRDAGLALVVAGEAVREQLPASAARLVTTEQLEADEGEEGEKARPVEKADPASPAYVIYTSGSTGEPKGVVVSHENVTRLFAVTHDLFEFDAGDVWTLFHSFAFDFSVWEIWGALLYGGRLVVVPYWISRSPAAFQALLADQRVTVVNQTPSAFTHLLAAPAGERQLALRWVIFGGEALDPRQLGSWVARHGDEQPGLVNMYGITETTVHVTWRRLRRQDVEAGQGSVIGVPLGDLAVCVLDRRGQPVPVGVAGELHVGGAGVATGYLHRPALTAQRFVPNPFPGAAGGRLYRSGDLGRFRASGELEYLGRIDHQVKVRGFRIELGEIETALRQHAAVAEAVVLARREGAEERRLVAYLVPAGDAQPLVEELRTFLRHKLPEYMVPAAFVLLTALPLTGNGKLDRDALPPPGEERPDLEQLYVAPRNAVERALCAIWSQVLGVEEVGIHDNFFALGGDSILSIRVVARAAQIGLAFALPDLFQGPTVAQLAARPALPQDAAAPAAAAPPRHGPGPFELLSEGDRQRLPDGLEDAYPLAYLQAGMLYHMVLTPTEPVYLNVDSWHVRGPFAIEPFRAAVDRTVARHPMLRTSFDLTGYSEPLQLVHRTAALEVAVEDVRHLPRAEQEARVDALIAAERRRGFDLAQAPQMRFHVFLRAEDGFQFTLAENHAIFDGWSLHATLVEVFDLYAAFLRGESPAPVPPPRLTYRDHVALERETAASREAAAYWTAALDRCPATEIPAWPAQPAKPPPSAGAAVEDGPRMRGVSSGIAPEDFLRLKALARTAEVPLKSVLLAAHLHALSVVSGEAEVVTGLVCSGRGEEQGGDEVRGLFLNTLPLRCRLAQGSWVELVKSAFAAEEGMLPYRRYPLAILQRERGRRPLFEAAFNYIHFHVARDLMSSEQLQIVGFKRGPGANFKLLVNFSQDLQSQQAYYELEHDCRQLPASQAASLCGLYERVLAAMAADPEARPGELSLLSAAERHQLIREWNDTRCDAGEEGCFLPLFAGQVARRPAAAALSGPGVQLTYAELDAAAERLARRLAGLGVGPEVRVGLCVERSPAMVVAMVAILKSGGSYVPLDPTYPGERLAFMLDDSRAAVLVTERRLLGTVAREGLPVVLLDEPAPEPLPAGAEPGAKAEAPGAPSPQNLAYHIYTSGSTGRPKAVAITHRNLASLIAWTRAAFTPRELAGVLASTSICFDLSVFETLAPLALGGRVIVAANALEVPLHPDRQAIRLINTVPSAMAELVRQPESLASVVTVNLAGEVLRRELVSRLHEIGVPRVLNLYGPSEDTTYSTCGEQVPGATAAPAIGRPIAGKRLYLLGGAAMTPVPMGVPGEIYLGGGGVARGYLGRPELTAERFVPDPFGTRGERLYRTGDLGKLRPDGQVEFLGRLDQQVKLRGFRIELGEVEDALAACPGVRDCAVLLEQSGGGDRDRLLACVVPEAGAEIAAAALRERLRGRLPEHMVPGEFVLVDALPRTSTGKIDRRGLEGMRGRALAPSAAPYAPPGNPTEHQLAAIWQELLGRDEVGVADNFFDLGGHSLLLIELQRRVRLLLDREVAMVELFRAPTIAAQARLIAEGPAPTTAAQAGEARAQARLAAVGAARARRPQAEGA